MKLLFDQNISHRVLKPLKVLYTEARQVKEVGLENATDKQIWTYAKQNNQAIVTFDADFYDLVTLYGHPPKVIWLRLGNTSTAELINIFEQHLDIIQLFLTDKSYDSIGCLEIDN